MADLTSILTDQGGAIGPPQQSDSGFGIQDIYNTYRMLTSMAPLLSAWLQGTGETPGPPSHPSILQNMVAQSIAHPGQPIRVSMADLMNPNILGLNYPKRPSNALPYTLGGIGAAGGVLGALPTLGKLGGGIANAIFGSGMPGGGVPGASGAPQPAVGAGQVPQVNLGGGITMDQYPVEQPVSMSPNDAANLALAGQDYQIDPTAFGGDWQMY